MVKLERIYRPTEAGLKAWQSVNSGLPAVYRRILGLIHNDTHTDVVRVGLRGRCPEEQIVEGLARLETLGFVESVLAGAEYDLDFSY
jgi:hypothetical protein